jgi:hypothetical protein
MAKKLGLFILLNIMLGCIYASENNFLEMINVDIDKIIEVYHGMDNNILLLELNYEGENFKKLGELFNKTVSYNSNVLDNVPTLNRMYWSCVRCLALSTVLYKNGYVEENNFINGTQLMKEGLIKILEGTETMGIDVMYMINYKPREYLE